MGKIVTFDRKVVETPFFTKTTAFEFLNIFTCKARSHFGLKCFLNELIEQLVKMHKQGSKNVWFSLERPTLRARPAKMNLGEMVPNASLIS